MNNVHVLYVFIESHTDKTSKTRVLCETFLTDGVLHYPFSTSQFRKLVAPSFGSLRVMQIFPSAMWTPSIKTGFHLLLMQVCVHLSVFLHSILKLKGYWHLWQFLIAGTFYQDYYARFATIWAFMKCQLSMSSTNHILFSPFLANSAYFSLEWPAGLSFPFRFKRGKKKSTR